MLRSAFFGVGRVPGLSMATFYGGKAVWNSAQGKNPTSNMSQEGNANSHAAAYHWLSTSTKLREIRVGVKPR
jgi:hypothetical protein